MKMLSIVAALSLSAAAVAPAAAAASSPAGEWVVQDHTAVVRISKCGNNAFCGFVAKGQPGKDYRNPDPRKRNRSVIGIQVMFNMRPAGDNAWAGETYNAEDGQIYNGKISLQSPDTLLVEGCVPGGGVCGSQPWTRSR
jgi:uncharacterized protein (DUF2147 family)